MLLPKPPLDQEFTKTTFTMPFTASDICKIILAVILPPLGVFLERGCGADLLINILLTILAYIPGIVHALYIILNMSYLTASLGPDELNALMDPMKPYDDAMRDLDYIAKTTRRAADAFEESLRVKNSLDTYEVLAKSMPSQQLLTAILNCEYKLWQTYEGTPMRFKPYLTHWVETLMRTEKEFAKCQHTTATATASDTDDTITTREVLATRAAYIMALLLENPLPSREPVRFAYEKSAQMGFSLPRFHLLPYMQMLVEEDVWDRLPEGMVQAPEKGMVQAPETGALRKFKAQEDSPPRPWEHVMLLKLKQDPNLAVQEISHLPLDISSLDFLTKLLADGTFEEFGIEGPPVILQYIQHALRLVEMMGAPPPTSEQNLHANGTANGIENGAPIVEYGKEPQSRAVRLLLLFIKNSISKGLLETTLIIFEIQEICVRYVWIKEVRDFRNWVEQSDLVI
ncbi:plasma membrane proteolipid 3 [Pyrenophora seminiperda CCB06]|uniref:Plasma membrane proteolipid 3 n=1 Tax=Pyrenophora seminiperda CCB06 TaxID=1302712 RepID=A0A3M7M765_9PLEO|nr:plasma membrane proteolipid 3 [Pyrenophora seminiperda CCB06]